MKEIEIPEGYEAKIKGNKVIIELKESEDERIRKEIIDYLNFAESHNLLRVADYKKKKGWLAYLELHRIMSEESKDKNPKPMKYIDAECLKAEIERRMKCYDRDGCEPNDGKWVELVTMKHFIEYLQQEQPGVWIKIDEDHPLPYGQEVIGYNKEWVHEDFNPSGTRIGFLSDIGFQSAKWNNDQDCYDTPCEEGDDYILSQIQPDGTKKTWCKYENGEAVEGYLPNMPTHYMLIPKTPDGFAWPYNAL